MSISQLEGWEVTAQRRDNNSTEFGLWLRNKAPDNETVLRIDDPLDSYLGYRVTNIDYVWLNEESGNWMIIEEKRNRGYVKPWQKNIFRKIHKACNGMKGYKGFHLLVFEKTNPEDGKIWLDRKEISKDDLIGFLKFEKQVKEIAQVKLELVSA